MPSDMAVNSPPGLVIFWLLQPQSAPRRLKPFGLGNSAASL
jgi:hypothetical protein